MPGTLPAHMLSWGCPVALQADRSSAAGLYLAVSQPMHITGRPAPRCTCWWLPPSWGWGRRSSACAPARRSTPGSSSTRPPSAQHSGQVTQVQGRRLQVRTALGLFQLMVTAAAAAAAALQALGELRAPCGCAGYQACRFLYIQFWLGASSQLDNPVPMPALARVWQHSSCVAGLSCLKGGLVCTDVPVPELCASDLSPSACRGKGTCWSCSLERLAPRQCQHRQQQPNHSCSRRLQHTATRPGQLS